MTDQTPYSSCVYINHFEWFTDEHLQAFENGELFPFEYHREVQAFYNFRSVPIQTNNVPEIKTYNDFPSNQQTTKEIGIKENFDKLQNQNHVPNNPDLQFFNNLNANMKTKSIESLNSCKTGSSASTLTNSCYSHSMGSFSSSTSCSVSSTNSFDGKRNDNLSPPKNNVQSRHFLNMSSNSKTINKDQKLASLNQNNQFLQEIRDFKFHNQPSPPTQNNHHPIFKQTSNPLLTSQHLHQELDRVREQQMASVESQSEDGFASSSQWSLI